MNVLLIAEGTTPLVMHNERLADPLDEHTRGIARISKKRGKTDADLMEIGRLEFLGGLYMNGNGPCIPATNILRCLQGGATRQKKGRDVLRGISPLLPQADLAYEGPREPDEMWTAGGFSLRKSVGIQRNRTMRTRPIFESWSLTLPVEVDPTLFDPDMLASIWRDAGRYEGLGEMRPVYGKFRGAITEWPIRSNDRLAEASFALATSVLAKEIRLEDEGRLQRHGDVVKAVKAAMKRAEQLRRKAKANGAA